MSCFRIIAALIGVCVLCSCTFTPPVAPPVDWSYAKDAISLRVTSDPQLNLFQRRPHALVVCVYHLRDSNGFNLLIEEKDGLQRLLDCGRFDASVTYAKKLIVQPGREVADLFDRPEGTKFAGIVAGYYDLRKEGAVRLFSIPVVEEKKWRSATVRLSNLNIDLYLGPTEIQDKRALLP